MQGLRWWTIFIAGSRGAAWRSCAYSCTQTQESLGPGPLLLSVLEAQSGERNKQGFEAFPGWWAWASRSLLAWTQGGSMRKLFHHRGVVTRKIASVNDHQLRFTISSARLFLRFHIHLFSSTLGCHCVSIIRLHFILFDNPTLHSIPNLSKRMDSRSSRRPL